MIQWGPEGSDKKMLRDSRKASNDLSDFRFSNLTLIFGHISREFSFSSLMKGGTKFCDSGFTSGSFVDAKNDGEDDEGEAGDQVEKADYQQWVEAKAPD